MPYIPKAICVKCKAEYKADKNGVVVHAVTGSGYYYSIFCDKWVCSGCGHAILIGFGKQPFIMNYQTMDGKIPRNLRYTLSDHEELVVKL
ncbi:hypothetical protein KAR91_34575 [Candidatus Pacearchaeota archaeon]|nr:hypothetical protein [Candidatus Pacearchaeota archaeon]